MHENPYAPPQVSCPLPDDFIDRVQRERLALEIRSFLSGDSKAFEDDELVVKFQISQDRAIQFVMDQLTEIYEESPDPNSKASWDLVQRLLLLLESNQTVEINNTYHWRASQLVAGGALLLYIAMVLHFQIWGWNLAILAIPFSLVAYGVEATYTPPALSSARALLYPFTSFTELKNAYNSVSGFRKMRFQSRKVSSNTSSDLMYGFTTFFSIPFVILAIALFCAFSPIVLLFLSFPSLEENVEILEPQTR